MTQFPAGLQQIPSSAFFNAFVSSGAFDLTHWHDGEIYGDSNSWFAEVVLWGGPLNLDPYAVWSDYTEADNDCERAFAVRLGPDQIRQAIDYVHDVADNDGARQRRLYLCREAAYEASRWFEGHWVGYSLSRTSADQLLQLAALLYAGERAPQVLFS